MIPRGSLLTISSVGIHVMKSVDMLEDYFFKYVHRTYTCLPGIGTLYLVAVRNGIFIYIDHCVFWGKHFYLVNRPYHPQDNPVK